MMADGGNGILPLCPFTRQCRASSVLLGSPCQTGARHSTARRGARHWEAGHCPRRPWQILGAHTLQDRGQSFAPRWQSMPQCSRLCWWAWVTRMSRRHCAPATKRLEPITGSIYNQVNSRNCPSAGQSHLSATWAGVWVAWQIPGECAVHIEILEHSQQSLSCLLAVNSTHHKCPKRHIDQLDRPPSAWSGVVQRLDARLSC